MNLTPQVSWCVCVCVLVDVVYVFIHDGCYIEMCMYHDFTEIAMSVLKGYGSQRLLVCHAFVPSMQV